ncbi:MAG: ABC transporter permease, partial [Candidatus Poribacteria bacterium]
MTTEERSAEYQQAILNDQKELGAVKVYSQLKTPVRKPPEVLSIFCEGFDKNPGNTVVVSYDKAPFGAIEEIGAQATKDFLVEDMLSSLLKIKNFLSAYTSIDMALVIQVVLSLLALIFSYDTISGERERGTLSLMMSNPLKRGVALIGKYIGGMISILIPIATSLILVLLVIEVSPGIRFHIAEWSRLGFILICSLIYISAFFLLGMFISSCTSKSATSLMIVLFLWVALAILLPNVGGYVARRIHPVENMEKVDAAIKSLDEEYNNELK